MATGSLGLGLPVGVGLALTGRFLDQLPYRVWVLCGDSELAEGSVWEAFEHAACNGLDNLTVIVDVNRLGQRGPTRHGWDTAAYARRMPRSAGTPSRSTGTDVTEIDRAYAEAAATTGRLTATLAGPARDAEWPRSRTPKARTANRCPTRTRPIRELAGRRSGPGGGAAACAAAAAARVPARQLHLPGYEVGSSVATRDAFGEALAELGSALADVVVLDGEVSDSTRTQYFAEAHPGRFFEFYVAEQQMTAAAIGMQARGWTPYLATFGAFLTRAHDFLRMASVSRAGVRVAGSARGGLDRRGRTVPDGAGGPGRVPGHPRSTVLYRCDANQTAWLTAALADREGVSYLRLTRGTTPVIYEPGEEFPVGGSRVLRSSADDQVTIAAAGITVPEALSAASQLAARGVSARVIDVYSVKPIDAVTLRQAAGRPGASSRSRITGRRVGWARRYWGCSPTARIRRCPSSACWPCGRCPARPPAGPARRRGHRLPGHHLSRVEPGPCLTQISPRAPSLAGRLTRAPPTPPPPGAPTPRS